MEGLIRILIALFLLLWARAQPPASSPALPPQRVQPAATQPAFPPPPHYNLVPTPTQETVREEISVGALVQVVTSNPAHVSLLVIASLDGCDFPVQVEQRQDDHDVYVTLYRELPQNTMCPAVLRRYQQTITLDGTFVSGETYTIHVNDFVLTVTV